LIVITADKGLCGAYNTNILKHAFEFMAEKTDASVELNILGKRGRDFFRRRSFAVRHEAINVLQKPSFADAAAIAGDVIEEFIAGRKDQVWIVYNEFKSVVQQRVVVEPLLPIKKLPGFRSGIRLNTCTMNHRRRFSTICCRAMWSRKSSGLSWRRRPRNRGRA